MSFKYQAQRISPNHYVLPRCGSMRVEAHAFLSDELYEASEETVWSQIANGASYEGVTGAYLMPDCHTGYGVPVGSVVVTDDTIIQGGSGYDISCGVIYMKADLRAKSVRSRHRREKWVEEVEKRVATGVGSQRPSLMKRLSSRQVDEVLRYGAKALGVREALCERQYIPVPDDLDLREVEKAYSNLAVSIGHTTTRRQTSLLLTVIALWKVFARRLKRCSTPIWKCITKSVTTWFSKRLWCYLTGLTRRGSSTVRALLGPSQPDTRTLLGLHGRRLGIHASSRVRCTRERLSCSPRMVRTSPHAL
jgi:hypothetical protein